MAAGRPVVYTTDEQKSAQKKKIALKAYLKKNNISFIQYTLKKKERIERQTHKKFKKWIKNKLNTTEGTSELIQIFLAHIERAEEKKETV